MTSSNDLILETYKMDIGEKFIYGAAFAAGAAVSLALLGWVSKGRLGRIEIKKS